MRAVSRGAGKDDTDLMTRDAAACAHKQHLVVASAGQALSCGLESDKTAESVTGAVTGAVTETVTDAVTDAVTGAVTGIVPPHLKHETKHCDDTGLRPTIYL